MYTYNTTKEAIRRVAFDSDGTPCVMDNSANCHICGGKSYFVESHMIAEAQKPFIGSMRIVGIESTSNGFGSM